MSKRTCTYGWILAAIVGLASGTTRAAWTGGVTGGSAGSASHTFNLGANWSAGSTIGDFGGTTFSGATTLYLSENFTLANGIDLSGYTGANTVWIVGGGTVGPSGTVPAAPRTLTLSGPVVWSGNNELRLGNGTSTALNLDLGGKTIEFRSNVLGRKIRASNGIANGSILKTGIGVLEIAGNTTYTGVTTVTGGDITLTATAVVKSLDMVIRSDSTDANASLTHTTSDAAVPTHLSGDTRFRLIGTGGATNSTLTPGGRSVALNITNSLAGTNVTQAFDSVTLVSGGRSNIIAHGRTGATAGNIATTFTLDRHNRSMAIVRSWLTTSDFLGTAQNTLKFADGTSLLRGQANVGGESGWGVQVIPWLLGNRTNASNQDILPNLVTYDAAAGVRILADSDYVISTDVAGSIKNLSTSIGDKQHLWVQTIANAVGGVNQGNRSLMDNPVIKTIQSLTVTGTSGPLQLGANPGAGSTLKVMSGAVLTSKNITGGTIDFGSAEGILYTLDSLVLRTRFSGSNGLTIDMGNRSHTVQIWGDSNYTGQTTLLGSGVVNFYGGKAIPDASDLVLHPRALMGISDGGFTAGNDRPMDEVIASLSGGGAATQATLSNAAAFVTLGYGNRHSLIIGQPLQYPTGRGALTLNGGYISPGFNNAGEEFGALAMSTVGSGGGATPGNMNLHLIQGQLHMDVSGTGEADLLSVRGHTVIDNAGPLELVVQVVGNAPTPGQSWTLIWSGEGILDGGAEGLFATITDNSAQFDFVASVVHLADHDELVLTAQFSPGQVAVNPEPGSVATLATAAAALLVRRRRR